MRVLVADDHAATRLLIADILEGDGHEVVLVSNGGDAANALSTGTFDLTIVDWMMPHTDGLQLCRAVREQERDSYLCIVLATARSQTADLVRGLEAGADDYLAKPFKAGELRARVRAGERMVRLQRELREKNRRSAELALTDELTGPLNRRAILQRLQQEGDRAFREHFPLSLIVIDIDAFKQVNDAHGHAAGDGVLREFAQRISGCVRSYDPVARIGGDEFLVVLSGVSEETAARIAERLRAAVADGCFNAGNHASLRITASFGVAQSDWPADREGLMAAADRALYAAKRGGGNRVSVSTGREDGPASPVSAPTPFAAPQPRV